jgi:hypothetical protein
MNEKNLKYKRFIETRLKIVNKEQQVVPFILNKIQNKYLTEDYTGNDIILKARQQGFSSLILAIFTFDFLLKENQRNVIVADIADNAQELLDRVKFYLKSYEEAIGYKIPLKYNSKYELFNQATNSRYTIGTADNTDFGRSKTVTNLHLSEAFFYPHFEKMLAGALQTVVPDGRVIFETTANGFNYGKTFWDACERGEKPFKALFYPASDFYDKDFLRKKEEELDRFFPQEYPETAIEAFVTSGDTFFNKESLALYLEETKDVKTISQN